MRAYAVIGNNSTGVEGSTSNCESKECCKENQHCNELGFCEPGQLGLESGHNMEKIEDEKTETTAEEFDYNKVEASAAARHEVISYFAPLGKVDSSWCIEDRDVCFEEGSECSLLSIPPLQSHTAKPLCQEGSLFMLPELKSLRAEDLESGKFSMDLPALIEILRKANSEQRQQCGAILALCREQEEGWRLAQACAASLFSGERNSAQPLPVSGTFSHLGPYQQWLAREMAWSVKLPSSIGRRRSKSLSGVQQYFSCPSPEQLNR